MQTNTELQQQLPFTPSAGVHSVKEASVGIYVTRDIENIKSFLDLAKTDEKLASYFPLSKTVYDLGERFEANREYSESGPGKIAGLVIAQVDENDNPTQFFQGINEDTNRRFFSFHETKYTRWAPFKEKLLQVLSSFLPLVGDFKTNGIALTYVDEYHWDNSEIDYTLIFNKNSKYLPPIFFEPGNTDANLNSTMQLTKDEHSFYVRLSIETSALEDKEVLRIIHNAVYLDKEFILSDILADGSSSKFSRIVQVAHELNKDLLKELLLPSVITRINMS